MLHSKGDAYHLDHRVRHACDRGGEARQDVWLVCRAVFQTGGATPLHIASAKGHVECVRALLGGGAAINQAMVRCASTMARHCGGCVCGSPLEPCHMHVQLVGWLTSARRRLGQEVVQPM